MKLREKYIIAVSILVILFVLNIFVQEYVNWQLDLTEDKRYTLTDSSKNIIENINEPTLIKVLLDGDLPAGFKELKNSTESYLQQLQNLNSNIEYIIEDPNDGNVEQINARREKLAEIGVLPTNLRIQENDELRNKQIYPYTIINQGDRSIIISLLEEQRPGDNEDVILNKSKSLIEYKFADAFRKLAIRTKKNIVFTSGHDELSSLQTRAIESELRRYYNTGRVDFDSIYQIPKEIDIVVVAKPLASFSDRSKFILDQYIMNGGKVIWMLDQIEVKLDSIGQQEIYIPPLIPHGLDDMLFKYGMRIQPNLVLDLESAKIPQVVGVSGGKPQIDLLPWPYYVLGNGNDNHAIGQSINRSNLTFCSSIDTIKTELSVNKTPLLYSSPYSRYQLTPIRMSFQILMQDFNPELFDKGPQPLAYLLEGTFSSNYKNRVSQNMMSILDRINAPYKDQSEYTSQIVISDGDLVKNLVDDETERISPVGYSRFEKTVYKGNQEFFLNCVEYLLYGPEILDLRSKETTLRLLDKVKIQDRSLWRFINIGVPILLLVLLGFIHNVLRQRKYAKS